MTVQKPGSSPRTNSTDAGRYNPGPVNESEWLAEELSAVQAQQKDVMLEEFPEGPYGAATNETKPGKTSPWREGQADVSSYRDQNPAFSDRKVPGHEPPANAPRGSIEGQN
jgi:hypothetical protein